MSATSIKRYQEKMSDIRLLLGLLKLEVLHAEEYRLADGADEDDVRELDKIIKPLAKLYGVLAADEELTTAETLRIAKDLESEFI